MRTVDFVFHLQHSSRVKKGSFHIITAIINFLNVHMGMWVLFQGRLLIFTYPRSPRLKSTGLGEAMEGSSRGSASS